MARMKNPAAIAKKWSQRLQSASQEMADGVNAVTVAPGVQAAKKKETMKARLLEAINNGKWERNVAAVPLGDWQQDMISRGIPRAMQGAAEAEPKMQAFMDELLPYVENCQRQIEAMPNATDADRKARMMKMFDLMKGFKRNRR